MELKIRKAVREDLPACADLMCERNLEYAPGLHQGLSEFEKNFDSTVFFVAEQNNEIIGFAYAFVMSPEMAFIDNVSVKKEFRGQGIGKKLMETLEQKLKSQVIDVWLIANRDDDKLKAFYSKNNYKQGHDFTLYWKEL